MVEGTNQEAGGCMNLENQGSSKSELIYLERHLKSPSNQDGNKR